MKKAIALLIALALTLGLLPTALAEAESAPALPQVGEVIHGFEVVELRDYPLINPAMFTGSFAEE